MNILKTIIESRIQYYIDTITLNESLSAKLESANTGSNAEENRKEKIRELFSNIEKSYNSKIREFKANNITESAAQDIKTLDDLNEQKRLRLIVNAKTIEKRPEVSSFLLEKEKILKNKEQFEVFFNESSLEMKKFEQIINYQDEFNNELKSARISKAKTICFFNSFYKLYDLLYDDIFSKNFSIPDVINLNDIFRKGNTFNIYPYTGAFEKNIIKDGDILILWPKHNFKLYRDYSSLKFDEEIMNMFILLRLLDAQLLIVNNPTSVFKDTKNPSGKWEDRAYKQSYLFGSTDGIDSIYLENYSRNFYISKNLFVNKEDKNYSKYRDLFVYFLFERVYYNGPLYEGITKVSHRIARNKVSSIENMTRNIEYTTQGYGVSLIIHKNIKKEYTINMNIQKLLSNVVKLDETKKQEFLETAFEEFVGKGGSKLPVIFKNNPNVLPNYLVKDFLQSITSEPVTSYEILRILANQDTKKPFLNYDLKILTSHEIPTALEPALKNNLFYIEKIKKGDKYKLIDNATDEEKISKGEENGLYYNRYGIYNEVEELSDEDFTFLIQKAFEIGDDTIDIGTRSPKKPKIYNDVEYSSKSFFEMDPEDQDRYAKLSAKHSGYLAYSSIEAKEPPYFNVDHLLGKWQGNQPSSADVTFFMLNDPELRISGRNELELSTFLNTLSTIELSKLQPYLDVTLEIPDLIRPGKKRSLITSSLTNYLFDSNAEYVVKKGEKNATYLDLSLKGPKVRGKTSTLNNMSLFTTPQTLNNFYEKNVIRESDKLSGRGIQDITRPFMSINSFTIDVAPTQGLMSFKTGKLSLTLHDKSRIKEVSAFIKPDMFGVHGSEITITYGWDGIEKEYDTNFLGTFLSSQKVKERYIITNSSFNITANGEVKIDLSIAMRGPIDLKNTDVIKEGRTKFDFDAVSLYYNQLKNAENIAKIPQKEGSVYFDFKLDIVDKIYADASAIKDIKTYKNEKSKDIIERINAVYKNLKNYDFNKFKKNKLVTYENTNPKFLNGFPRIQEIHELINKKGEKTGHYSIALNKELNYNTSSTETQINDSFDALKLIYKNKGLLKSFVKAVKSYISSIRRESEVAEDAVKFLFEGVNNVDPFYDRLLVQQFLSIDDRIDKKINLDDLEGLKKAGGTFNKRNKLVNESDYVSLGNIITGLISLNLKNSGKYDDIQIVSYCANKNAGLMSRKNLASLLIRKEDVSEGKGLRSFLFDMLTSTSRSSLSLEGLLAQIIEKFVNTNSNISYGLSSLFKLENEVLTPKFKTAKKQKAAINKRLKIIYDYIIYNESEESNIDYEFIPPKVKFSFDTRVSEKNETILRISIYDENDNPFKAVSDIFIADKENSILGFSTMLGKTKAMGSNKEYTEAAEEVVKKLLEDKVIGKLEPNKDDKEGIVEYFMPKQDFYPIKKEIKKKVPSLTYGTQNSAIIDASVTTVNEAKLNTVFMTRSGIKTNRENRVLIDDLPLNVLPAQATATIYGCPFINFAQMLFLDFETNTTLDNIYAVTGIKHDISPGKFTTSLTLTYADIYGKYRNAFNNINEALNRAPKQKFKPASSTKKSKDADTQKTSPTTYINKTSDVFNVSASNIKSIVQRSLGQKYKLFRQTYYDDLNDKDKNLIAIQYYVYIDKTDTEKIKIYKAKDSDNTNNVHEFVILHKLKNSIVNVSVDDTQSIENRSFKIIVNGNKFNLKLQDLDNVVTEKNYNIHVYNDCVKSHLNIEQEKIETQKEILFNFEIVPNFQDAEALFNVGIEIKRTNKEKRAFIETINKKINKALMDKIRFPKVTNGSNPQVSFPKVRGYSFLYGSSNKKLSIYKLEDKRNIKIAEFTESGIKEFIKKLIDNYCDIITG